MKILFASDIHGSPEALLKLESHLEKLQPEQIVLLGDELYHGPRNPLRPDYAPPNAADILNKYASKIIAVRGNCDAEVDQLLLKFPIMAEYSTLLVDGLKFFLTHGHHWNPDRLPPLGTADVLAYGHTHIPMLKKLESGVIALNPGSLSLPKGGFPASFAIYQDMKATIFNLETLDIMNELQF